MRNSKTSYTGKDFKLCDYAQDGAKVTIANVHGAAGGVTGIAQAPFFGSKELGKNMGADKGLVHEIWAIMICPLMVASGANINAILEYIVQLWRRDDPLFTTNPEMTEGQERQPDMVPFEMFDVIRKTRDGTTVQGANEIRPVYLQLLTPIYMVKPYVLSVEATSQSQAAQTVTSTIRGYVFYKSMVVEGKPYRQLLEAYTRIPFIKEIREPSGRA